MNEELIKQVEQLLDYGYGDSLRLDSIIEALKNGRPLYSSDQKYVDTLISKYLYPQEEEVQDLKNQISSLEQKINDMKGEHYGDRKKLQDNISINHCSECGFIISRTHNFCPKCGIHQDGSGKYKKYSGDKITNSQKAGIVIAVIIVSMIIYGSLNLYALGSLQFRSTNSTETFDYTDLSVPIHLEACNPSFFQQSDKISIGLDYKSTNLGHLILYGKTIPPGSAVPVDGEFKMNGQGILQLFIGGFASAFSGQQNTFDPTQMHITSTLNTSLFGVIPFSISKDYSVNDFKNMILSNKTSQFSC